MHNSSWRWGAALLFGFLLSGHAAAQATRTWVSGVGDDVNPCSRTAPCKTFAGTIAKTAVGGTIDVLDPGGFGSVTITKSITIENVGRVGGILASGVNGINVNAAGAVVTLRGLQIEGEGTTTGVIGVNLVNAAQLTIEDSDIFAFQTGTALCINFAPSASAATLVVRNSTIHKCGASANVDTTGGIKINPTGTGSANVVLDNVHVVANNGFGVLINGPSTVTIRDSLIGSNLGNGVWVVGGTNAATATLTQVVVDGNDENGIYAQNSNASVQLFDTTVGGNAKGLNAASGGAIVSFGNNGISGNVVDGAASGSTAQH